jgi:hypothetical protein
MGFGFEGISRPEDDGRLVALRLRARSNRSSRGPLALPEGGAGQGRRGRDRLDEGPANAPREANRGYQQIAREVLAEAAETDRREDELYGEARGDELPERLRTGVGRRAALREAKEDTTRIRAERAVELALA